MSTIGNLSVTISANATAFNNAINNVNVKVNQLKEKVEGPALAGAIAGATAAAVDLAAALGGKVLGALRSVVEQSLTLAGSFEQAQIALKVMTGSAETARRLVGDLAKFAVETPFKFDDLLRGTRLLKAMGVETGELLPTLKMLGNAAAGLSVPISQIGLAYGQVKAKGKLMGPELRQFTEAGVPMVEELARIMFKDRGKTREVYEAIEDGKVGFYDMALAFENMSREGGVFFNMMVEQNESLVGRWNAMKETFQLGLAGAGQSLAEGLGLKEGMATATALFQGLKDHVDELRPVFEAAGRVGGLALRLIAGGASVAWNELKRLAGFAADAAPDWEHFKGVVLDFARDAGKALLGLYDILLKVSGAVVATAAAVLKFSGKALGGLGPFFETAGAVHPSLAPLKALGMIGQGAEASTGAALQDLLDFANKFGLRAAYKPFGESGRDWEMMIDRIRNGTDLVAASTDTLVDKIGEVGAQAKRAAAQAAEAFRVLREESKKVNESFEDPLSTFADSVRNFNKMLQADLISTAVYNSAVAKSLGDLEKKFPPDKHERPAALVQGTVAAYSQELKLRDAARDSDPVNRIYELLKRVEATQRERARYEAAIARAVAKLPGEVVHAP